jgi:hypothetical protein
MFAVMLAPQMPPPSAPASFDPPVPPLPPRPPLPAEPPPPPLPPAPPPPPPPAPPFPPDALVELVDPPPPPLPVVAVDDVLLEEVLLVLDPDGPLVPVPAMPPVPVVVSSSVQRDTSAPSPPKAPNERNCLRDR